MAYMSSLVTKKLPITARLYDRKAILQRKMIYQVSVALEPPRCLIWEGEVYEQITVAYGKNGLVFSYAQVDSKCLNDISLLEGEIHHE